MAFRDWLPTVLNDRLATRGRSEQRARVPHRHLLDDQTEPFTPCRIGTTDEKRSIKAPAGFGDPLKAVVEGAL